MKTGDTLELEFESERKVLSVSNLNREARLLVEGGFGSVWVEGEISNLARPSSGHMYWTLKDARAQVRCAMFRQSAVRLRVAIENGQQVLVRARVSIYETRGEFQLIADYLEEAGEGVLLRRFEELKRKLAAEGLFDAERKRAIPSLPVRIGVVTSPTGAAIRDVLIALTRRFPATSVLIYPTSVQGQGAAEEISRALRLADERAECDVVILTRGGGSLEDLWAFNEEIVARAIDAMTIPVIVGVGHEIDFTIADFVADVRAPTPSQAAELAVPEQSEIVARLNRYADQLRRGVTRRVADETRRLDALSHRLYQAHPGVAVRSRHQRLDELEARLRRGIERAVAVRRVRLAQVAARVAAANPRHRVALARQRWDRANEHLGRAIRANVAHFGNRLTLADRALTSLSPLATLERGYAIVSRRDDGSVVTDSGTIERGTGIDLALARGRLAATVDSSDPPED
ncbi:exodeoxyribonuclease VII large subunit [Candidatus Rariloculus sp.]|uniref:exodeoxyribonuclease VII large subunit n=1 Tax=Candidatus Rariloculus sp. TaxID=3101265 RepID=UPI003D0F06AA